MTLNELKERIAESADHEWFQKYGLTLNSPTTNLKLTFTGVVSIYEFVLNQIEGFNNFQKLPHELQEVKKLFINAKDSIVSLIQNNNADKYSWNNHLSPLTSGNRPIFLSNSPEAGFLVDVHREREKYYRGAYEYLVGSVHNANNKDLLTGYLMAYEFSSKDFSALLERKEAEKKSISKIRDEFQEELGKAEVHVVEYLNNISEKSIDYTTKIDRLKEEKENAYNGWFGQTSNDFAQFYSESNKKIKELEKLYQEKLKLEAPAKYWNDRAKKLRSEGYRWLGGLIFFTLIAIGLLIWTLSEISTGTIEKIFQNTGIAIKWSIVYVTLISFLAFAIRIFSKITFSSFHLVRDAEEREQLTYVYLALQKEKGIDQTERHLIMQSLFSRADSGLLKDDASPTMPGNIVDKMITK